MEGDAFADDASAIGHAIMRDYKSRTAECNKEIAEHEIEAVPSKRLSKQTKLLVQDSDTLAVGEVSCGRKNP
jgi:hypothetical protein